MNLHGVLHNGVSLQMSFLNPWKYFSRKSLCAGTCSPTILSRAINEGGGYLAVVNFLIVTNLALR